MKYIVIGGVAGGATAAARIRRNTEQAEIILFEKGEYISYANCGLPYYIGGVIAEREKLFVQTPEAFGKRFNIDVRTRSEVIAIHSADKTVDIRTSDGKTYTESYDKLLLSPGASPVRPPLPGIDNEGIFTLRNVNDTDAIKSYLQQHKVKRAVIIGAGFIGLEMAENLQEAGAEVAVVEMANQVMAPIDFSMASLVHEHLLQKGVHLYLEKAVASFERTVNGLEVIFKSGERLPADMVLLSIGVRPNTSLVTEAGLEIGEMRGIKVNDYLQTSDEYIYAVGDAIEFRHPLTDRPWLNYLAGPANRQARIVADNMVFGNKVTYEGAVGTSIAKIFDMTVAASGLPAKRLKQAGIDYLSATIHSGSHAGYYPDALQMSIKITFSPVNGKLLGAQIVGYNGVDKRIDEFSQVIKHNGTVYDLMALEQAYAPPFSSAKDPVAVAGYVAGNILSGKMKPLYWRELQAASSSDSSKVDHSEHSKDSAEAYTIASSVIPSMKAIKVDACGISCPGPIMKLKKSMEELADGERLEIVATDAGFPRDAEAWCQTTGNRFVSVKSGAGKYEVIVEKSTPQSSSSEVCREDKGKTFILFSDDLDKVLATFVLANGAAATGKKVTIFFTFWGLNAIKRLDKPAVKKDIWGKMFGMMLPSSSLKLRLSKMNMGGMGARMMRYIMNKKNIDSLESLRTQAIQNGVEFIACQMSMDVMGVKREELLDHVTIGGVATYMNRAEQANVNLFI